VAGRCVRKLNQNATGAVPRNKQAGAVCKLYAGHAMPDSFGACPPCSHNLLKSMGKNIRGKYQIKI
jgi:hypothetical protein